MPKLNLKRCTDIGFHFHQFKCLVLYSTISQITTSNHVSTNPHAQFLVNSYGFAANEAVSVVAKSKVSQRFKSTQKSQLVLDFLKSSGFDDIHVRKLVIGYPKILLVNIEKTLEPKLRAFQDLGLSGAHLGLVISRHPCLLSRSLNRHIMPALEMLKSLLGSSGIDNNEKLIGYLLRVRISMLLSTTALKYIPPKLLFLQSYGVPREKIATFILRKPHAFLHTTKKFVEVVNGVEEKFGITRDSSMFLHAINGLDMKIGDRLEPWLQVFRSFGWTDANISKMIRVFPACLTTSENAMMAKLKYLMEDLGFGSDCLLKYPALLSYSEKKRIAPRIAVMHALGEKQLLKNHLVFYKFMSMAESKFMEKYMVPARDELPQLYDYYIQTRDGSPAKT